MTDFAGVLPPLGGAEQLQFAEAEAEQPDGPGLEGGAAGECGVRELRALAALAGGIAQLSRNGTAHATGFGRRGPSRGGCDCPEPAVMQGRSTLPVERVDRHAHDHNHDREKRHTVRWEDRATACPASSMSGMWSR